MRLGPGAHQLIFLSEGEDVVANDVFPAVMLVKSGALAAIDQIVLQQDSGATLICVETPSPVGESVDVVNQVVANDGARLRAERVNGAHVAQPGLADMMHMVELDNISTAGRFAIAPGPSDGNG